MWAMTVMASGKRGAMTQSNGKGPLKVRGCHQSGWNEVVNKANTIAPGPAVSKVSGTIGLPASSFRAATFAAQRMVAMLMKTELLAMCRPTQILSSELQSGNQLDALQTYIPLSKSLRQNVSELDERMTFRRLTNDTCPVRGGNSPVRFDG